MLGISSLVLFGFVYTVQLTAFTTSGVVTRATGFLVGWSLLLDSLFLPTIARRKVRASR